MTSIWHRKFEPVWSKIASWTTHVGTSASLLPQWCPLEMHCFPHFEAHCGQLAPVLLRNLTNFIDLYRISLRGHCCLASRQHFLRNIANFCTDIVIRSPWHTLYYGWRVGVVYASCHCNLIRENRYRGTRLVTLLYLTLSYPLLSYLILSYLILYYLVLSYCILYLYLSYLVLPYRILSYLILSYLILSYHIVP